VERSDGSVTTFPRSWTSLAVGDPIAVLSGGTAHFRPEDLAEIVEMIAGIQGVEALEGTDDV
jgi:hypothetical protein